MIKIPISVNIFLEKECFFTGVASVNRTEVEKNPKLSNILQAYIQSRKQHNSSTGNDLAGYNSKSGDLSKKADNTAGNNSRGRKAVKNRQVQVSVSASKTSKKISKKGGKDGGKQKSEQEKSQNQNDFQDEQMQVEGEQEFQNDFEDQNDQVRVMDQQQNEAALQQQMLQEMEMQEQIDDSLDESISEQDDDLSLSNINNFTNLTKYKTKRQRGDYQDFRELPDKKPRKKKNQADDIVRRQEKQKKRKQYLKKQLQAQQKATLDKILHETGRQLRLREQKETKNQIKRQNRKHNTLGDVPKIITKNNQSGNCVMIHKTSLFSDKMTQNPEIKMKELCSICQGFGKYKIRDRNCYACSLSCYKRLVL